MSSTTVDRPSKVGLNNKKENENNTKARRISNASHKKHKHEENRHFKFGRKRLQSFTGNGKFFPPYKRRKKEGAIIPPTKFLLGGNICDPLNLNSMQDEEINRAMNAVTPKSSPLPTPKHRKEAIEVIIPPNIHDPLNLINCNDNDEYEKQLISPVKKNSKKRNRKRKKASSPAKEEAKSTESTEIKESVSVEEVKVAESIIDKDAVEPEKAASPSKSPPQEPQQSKVDTQPKEKVKLRLKGSEEPKDKRLRKVDIKDKIVSPVIPQPGAWKPRQQHRPNQEKKKKTQQQQLPKFNQKNARFQYGNYNRYYGYRNPHHDIDPRLNVFSQRKELFYGKDILDIGCNIGHVTLSIARDFSARSVTGIDIDKKLINIARKNVKHYVNCVQSPASTEDGDHIEYDANYFPISMLVNYGPVDIPGFTKHKGHKGFPHNVTFVQGNYVLEDDALLSSEQPQFDTILCLSITKWIHLNFGDAGLKQSFKRMHAQLRPGGVLILEPQNWSSYSKKKSFTEKLYKNYQTIEFFPNKFTQYLLSPEVGFRKCEVISVPPHPSKGFQRPIYLYTKADLTSTATATITSLTLNVAGSSDTGTEEPAKTVVVINDVTTTSVPRNERRQSLEQMEQERRLYERELFSVEVRKETWEVGNSSETSQRSGESLSQYEQLENVYAPSATPCYDTPIHNPESALPPDPEKMCYLDVQIEHDQAEKVNDEEMKPAEEDPQPQQAQQEQQQRPESKEKLTDKQEDKT